MKRIIYLFIVMILIFTAGCSNKVKSEITIDEALDENNIIVWNPYWWYEHEPCSLPQFLADYDSDGHITEYQFYYSYLDVNSDGERDVIIASENFPIQFVVIKQDGKFYGKALSLREGDLFFSNGYILADGGGGSEFYYRIRVKEDGIVREDIAWITDDKPMRYFIMDNEVTEQEYEAWIEENCKEIINFEHYEKEVIPMRSNDCPPGTPITFLPYNKR